MCLPEQQTRAGTSTKNSLTNKLSDNNMKAKYIKPEMWDNNTDLEKDVLLIASETPADPEKPQETKEEKNAWNEGLW